MFVQNLNIVVRKTKCYVRADPVLHHRLYSNSLDVLGKRVTTCYLTVGEWSAHRNTDGITTARYTEVLPSHTSLHHTVSAAKFVDNPCTCQDLRMHLVIQYNIFVG